MPFSPIFIPRTLFAPCEDHVNRAVYAAIMSRIQRWFNKERWCDLGSIGLLVANAIAKYTEMPTGKGMRDVRPAAGRRSREQ